MRVERGLAPNDGDNEPRGPTMTTPKYRVEFKTTKPGLNFESFAWIKSAGS